MHLAALRIGTRRNTGIGDEVELVSHDQGRGGAGGPTSDLPSQVSRGDIPLTAGADRIELRKIVVDIHVEQPMREDRSGHHREAGARAHLPERSTAERVVGVDATSTRTDELLTTSVGDEQGRAERELLGQRIIGPPGLPPHRTRLTIQRDHKRIRSPIATEDQMVSGQNGRPTIAMDRRILNRRLSPNHLPLQIQTGRPQVSKMGVEPTVAHHRCRAGIAVLAMDIRPIVRRENIGAPEDCTGPSVEAQHRQFETTGPGLGAGTRQVEALLH